MIALSSHAHVPLKHSTTSQVASDPLTAGHAGSAELKQAAMEGWRARLAAACVLRALPGWRSRASSGGITGSMTAASLPAGWRQEAAKQLSELVAAGIDVDVDRWKHTRAHAPTFVAGLLLHSRLEDSMVCTNFLM